MTLLDSHIVALIRNANGFLNLDNAGIFDCQVDEICSLIRQNGSITALSLFDNNLRNTGAIKLAELLPPTVKELNLRRNSISDDGAIALISNPQFEGLSFSQSGGRITEKTGEIIIASSSQLYIDLKSTMLSENLEMMAKIEVKFKKNRSMKVEIDKRNDIAIPGSHARLYLKG